jgi:Outer membrane protein beta-barrel domain
MKTKIFIIIILLIVIAVRAYSAGDPLKDSFTLKKPAKSVTSFIEGEYTYIRHLGHFGETWGTSQGGYLSYGFNFNNQYMLIFRSGYLKTSVKEGVEFPENAGLGVIPLLAGGKYLFNLGHFRPYFSFMTGFNLVLEEYDIEGNKTDKSLMRFHFELGTGSYFAITKNLNIDFRISYNAHFYQIDAQMTGFEYTAGVLYEF